MFCARQKSERRGAAALEFILVAIPFLLLVLVLLDFGCLILTQHLVTNAARQGGRRASVNTDVNNDANEKPPSEIENEIRAALVGLLDNPQVQLFYFDNDLLGWTAEATFQRRIAVEVQGQYVPFTPLFSMISAGTMGSIPLSTRSVVRSEGH